MFPKTLIISWLVFHPHTKTPAYCILWLRGSYCVLWSNVACGMEMSKLYFISIHDRVKLISQLDLTLLHSYQQSTCNGEGDVRQTIYSPDWIIFPMEGFRGSQCGGMGVILSILNATLFQKKKKKTLLWKNQTWRWTVMHLADTTSANIIYRGTSCSSVYKIKQTYLASKLISFDSAIIVN